VTLVFRALQALRVTKAIKVTLEILARQEPQVQQAHRVSKVSKE
jgi:hypothetical protein